MDLKTYISKHKTNASAIASAIDVFPSTITRIVQGKTKPDWKTMESLYKATGGRVRPNDFAGFL